jgi:hypothetical protein
VGTFGGLEGCPCCELQRKALMNQAVDQVRALGMWLAHDGPQDASNLSAALSAGPPWRHERESLQPMVTCLGLSSHDRLQHFIASSA